MDGICHKATEYSIIVAFVAAAYAYNPSTWTLLVGLALFWGEAMCAYAEERRILVIRLHAQPVTYITPPSPHGMYRLGDSWWSFPPRKKLNTIIRPIEYKAPYAVIALSMISTEALVWGLLALAAYKHVSWIRLIAGTVRNPPHLRQGT
jgi:hypothetical protein